MGRQANVEGGREGGYDIVDVRLREADEVKCKVM